MRAAFPSTGWPLLGKSVALILLAVADVGLVVVVTGSVAATVDAVAPLTGHLYCIGIAAGIALLVRRRIFAVLTIGVAATIGLHAWLGLSRCCGPDKQTPPGLLSKAVAHDLGRRLTVLALNTWRSGVGLERIERYLAEAPFDVIVLSEFGPAAKPMLERLRRVYPYQAQCGQHLSCALAVLSRGPFEAAGSSRIAAGEPTFVWARLPGALTIIGTHLANPALDPWLHRKQIVALVRFIRNIDGPLVLAGDLNTSPWSNGFRLIREAANLSPANPLTPSWPAWPVALPQIALDHIFVSSDLGITAAGAGPAVGSDHLPVWAALVRRGTPAERRRSMRPRFASSLAAPGAHLGSELLAHLGSEQGGTRNLRR